MGHRAGGIHGTLFPEPGGCQFSPHVPPQHEPVSQEGAASNEEELLPTLILGAERRRV